MGKRKETLLKTLFFGYIYNMKKASLWLLCSFFTLSLFSQSVKQNNTRQDNTLLWRISGKNLSTPSYLFGTIHMICADDIQLSDSLLAAIKASDNVYLELDMDNLFELMNMMTKIKMRGDTTLADLLTPDEYQKVKTFFSNQKGLIPFSMLETYKPMLTISTLMQSELSCNNAIAMEQLIMSEAKKNDKKIKGLETMSYQMSIFDSIPYKIQAKQLLQHVNEFGQKKDNKLFEELTLAYRQQQLSKLGEITEKDDSGIKDFTQILLYNRNINWVKKLEEQLGTNRLVIAVGAGHLPGNKGLINLLRRAGYKVEPVKNEMIKKKEKQI